MKPLLVALILLCLPGLLRADDRGPLLHWKFDEGRGTVAQDATGHGLVGSVSAIWGTSASGNGLLFDGTAATVVTANLSAAQRLGKSSWTVMAWVKPQQFTIDVPQNQRRLFAYGSYPQAFFCVDLLANGEVALFQVYQKNGKDSSALVTSSTALTLNQWAHLAVVFDRQAELAQIYLNGRLRGEQKPPLGFDPDLSVGGEFTVGNGWQNYWGAADEVQLYRRALTPAELKAEFARLKGTFKVILTAEDVTSDALDAFQAAVATANQAWEKRDFAAVRKVLVPVLSNMSAPAHYRSYAHLRLAQSYEAEGKPTLAREEYSKVAAERSYPEVHRTEAAALAQVRPPVATRLEAPSVPTTRLRIFVAPGGSDSNPGTVEKPLATLTAARDRVRLALRNPERGSIEVVLAPGEYPVTDTLTLYERDSGTAAAPVVYRAQKPGTAVLYGGKRLTGFSRLTDPAVRERLPAEARGKVVQYDLKALGITDYGTLAVRGFGQAPSPPTVELYIDQKPQTLARWPNTGFTFPTKLVESGSKTTPSVLGYDDPRHARWTTAEDAWIFGYFHFLWADATAKIGTIDPVAKTIATTEAYQYDGNGMNNEQGIKYYAFNLLEELDHPGEWYLNRKTGMLYLYPPTDLTKATVELGLLDKPMLSASKLVHVRFEGLTFDLGRGDGIVLKDSSDCQLVGCTVQRMAGSGIRILGGARNTLLSCDIHTVGRRATEVIGGDRGTLIPGKHTVANSLIHDFGRIDRTYTPGVQLEGVGNHVTHNLFYNSPSSALRIEGNDHVIEYNEVRDVLQESDDQGAMELFLNPTYRGVVFRHNYFHHIGSGDNQKLAHGQAGIRLDDAISGVLIYGNVFYKAANGSFGAVQINSGRDNVIDNNVFVDSDRGISGGYDEGNGVWKRMRDGGTSPDFYTTALYIQRYPELESMLKQPATNHVWRNVFYRVGRDLSGNRAALSQLANATFGNQDPGFVDGNRGNFRLKSDALLFNTIGFRPIPFEEIGLYADPWRVR